MSYAVLHRNMAHIQLTGTNVNSDEFDEKSKVIANYLCKASGIFEYISYVVFSKLYLHQLVSEN